MFQDGQTLGDFEILGRLGHGGMGAVYKARQVSLERLVALKTLQASLAGDPEYIARFRREAKAAAGLNHPNLVQVYAAGENDGLHWFAMEYVEGESAQDRLKRKGRIDPAEAIAIAIHIATALDYAWRKAQLIHRDIKPDNIFLSSDGEVKLGDLGLAKNAGETQSLTMTGASMGTPHYVSPEQAEGKKDMDLRAARLQRCRQQVRQNLRARRAERPARLRNRGADSLGIIHAGFPHVAHEPAHA